MHFTKFISSNNAHMEPPNSGHIEGKKTLCPLWEGCPYLRKIGGSTVVIEVSVSDLLS